MKTIEHIAMEFLQNNYGLSINVKHRELTKLIKQILIDHDNTKKANK